MPKFSDLKKYCEKTGWVLIKKTDHLYYKKILDDGNVLRTKVSLSLGKEIPKNLWKFILKNQLQTNIEEFNKNS